MIARIILIFAAFFGLQSAYHGFQINAQYSDIPEELSVDELYAASTNAPKFLKLSDEIFTDGVCETTTVDDRVDAEVTYIPLLTAADVSKYLEGGKASAQWFMKIPECRADGQPLPPLQGVISQTDASLNDVVRATFAKNGIVTAKKPMIIDQQMRPDTVEGNLLTLIISAIALFAGVVPFFDRHKWASETDLSGMKKQDLFDKLFPILRVPDALGESSPKLVRAISTKEERVVLKLNCEYNGRPALAVATNQRLLLFRTKFQLGLRIIKGLQNLIDKAPGGGLISMMLEPFSETYQMITDPVHEVYREAMGYSNDELTSGSVPWKRITDMTWEKVAQSTSSITMKTTFWSGKLKVEFAPRKISGLFATPKDFIIPQKAAAIGLAEFTEMLRAKLERAGCEVKIADGQIDLDLEGLEIASS